MFESPDPKDLPRLNQASQRRNLATTEAFAYGECPTLTNSDETALSTEGFPANFTKGLKHNAQGMLMNAVHYTDLRQLINQPLSTDFSTLSKGINGAADVHTSRADGAPVSWRGWESPRTGHYYALQGADAEQVAMSAAPDLGSTELIAEMLEVYALALLRDVPFTQWQDNTITTPDGVVNVNQLLTVVRNHPWFTNQPIPGLTASAIRRRLARSQDPGAGGYDIDDPGGAAQSPTSEASLFRGSGPGVKTGPYVSQFLVDGTTITNDGAPVDHINQSEVAYGTQVIDQRVKRLPILKDYMVHWNAWLDVQNGANFTGDTVDSLEKTRAFIHSPRDLAAYVRLDALYQAYLNAGLYMMGRKGASGQSAFSFQQPVSQAMGSPGFPDQGIGDPRTGFASFGGPHLLSLVTEVATRCLKAVRRQKFNYHRRARPERIGGLLTAMANQPSAFAAKPNTAAKLQSMLTDPVLTEILGYTHSANEHRISSGNGDAHLDFGFKNDAKWYTDSSEKYLLPMAFAEGSPMHPSYGAGHATVAGGCVTILKAFFNTVNNGNPVAWPLAQAWVSDDGDTLYDDGSAASLTINGELNKLAANISIGRNMAGVHYYSDYYDSLRMGERVATSILIEQMYNYDEPVEFDFISFDGDHVHILRTGQGIASPVTMITNGTTGNPVPFLDWWCRHNPVPIT